MNDGSESPRLLVPKQLIEHAIARLKHAAGAYRDLDFDHAANEQCAQACLDLADELLERC